MEEEEGIFLFKNSKCKVTEATIFHEQKQTEKEESETLKNEISNTSAFHSYQKWFKGFLRRFQNPSGFFYPIQAISPEQIISESRNKSATLKDENVISIPAAVQKKRRITRGNRRHKIKTRRLRNKKNLKHTAIITK